ncbi:DUF1211 domain-containing protein [Arthrobacter alpinus]|nr:DUF1211 domain-containing protein [Arthrobacter alpinus]
MYVGLYWNNHRHMIKLATDVSGGILWAAVPRSASHLSSTRRAAP